MVRPDILNAPVLMSPCLDWPTVRWIEHRHIPSLGKNSRGRQSGPTHEDWDENLVLLQCLDKLLAYSVLCLIDPPPLPFATPESKPIRADHR